ncbi:MAG: S41 family peptidase [Bacillota bacterium]
MNQRNGILKRVLKALVVFSVFVTVSLTVLVVVNLDTLGQAVRVVGLIKSQSINEVDTAGLIKGATVGMVDALGDPYSVYMEPKLYENMQKNIKGVYGGVGLLITMGDDHRLIVVSPFKGTPAQRAGIVSGDQILKIDEKDVAELDLEDAAELMQGEPGTSVVLLIYREGEPFKEVTLIREVVEIPTVEGEFLEGQPGIGYVNISNFSEHTGFELGKVLAELGKQPIKGLILDLRSNPGGSLNVAVEVASYFVPKGPVVHIVGKSSNHTMNTVHPHRLDVPLAVLVNKGSASASEIVAGAIKDTNSGILVGETTFGKGLVQTLFQLSGGAALKLTTAKYLTPNNQDINKVGIIPDVEVKLTPEEEAIALAHAPDTNKDAQLAKAIELLQ